MKYTRLYIFLLAALVLTPLPPLPAQSNSVISDNPLAVGSADDNREQLEDSVITIKKRVDEVNLLFIATNKHGRFVRNLDQTDFTILDDHKPPQSIVNFHSETDLPLELGLLIDTSGSVRARFDFEQESAISFLEQTVRPHFDKAFVMGFNSHATLTQDFTDNTILLRIGVHRLQNGGGTALFDAIYRACRTKLMKVQDGQPARRAVIVVSDGEDNQSDVSEKQAVEMAQRAEVIIYAISTDDSGLILRGDTVLQQLADATGGRAFFPYKTKDVKSSFAAIEDELRSQYVVSYRPADFEADGRYRPIEITALKKDLQVRARKGYYAPTH
ncbi:MAG TPA: VWA domain-containing protein [Terriglobales bacterium]|nr:VWA domain-containing protein [Terriglobales bacterium]